MKLLSDIEHAEGSLNWLISALHALEDRLISIEALIEEHRPAPEAPASKAP